MDEQLLNFGTAKIMEPLYRMQKIIAAQDEIDAKTTLALCVQYITEHFQGGILTIRDVQNIICRALLHYKNGQYYGIYITNELQVMVAGWLTLLAADRPVTLEQLGKAADALADQLAQKSIVDCQAEDILTIVKTIAGEMDSLVYERLLLNEANFLAELQMII